MNVAKSSSIRRTISSTSTSTQSSFQPLTTLFVPSTSCSGTARTRVDFVQGFTEIFGEPGYSEEFQNYMADCYPAEALDRSFTYSPGICPSGFTTAYSTVIGNSITSAQCCPQGFVRWKDEFATVSVPTNTKTESCFRTYTTSTAIECSWNDSISGCVRATVGPGVDESAAVYVLYQSKDLSLFPKDYTPDGALAGATTQTLELQTGITTLFPASTGNGPADSAASSTSTSLQLTETPRSSVALSAGMKAGIAVGVIIGVCGLLGLGMLFLWRRKRQRKGQAQDLPNTDLPEFVAATKSKPHMAESRASSDVKPTYAYHHVGEVGELDGSNQSPGLQELPAIPRLSYSHDPLDESSRPAPVTPQLNTQQLKEPHDQKLNHQEQTNLPNEPGSTHESNTILSTDISRDLTTARPEDADSTVKSIPEPKSKDALLLTPSNRAPPEVPQSALPKPKNEMSAADWELLYLESEERRIQERRETIMRTQDP